MLFTFFKVILRVQIGLAKYFFNAFILNQICFFPFFIRIKKIL